MRWTAYYVFHEDNHPVKIRVIPSGDYNPRLAEVRSGDVILVIPELTFHGWVAARFKNRIGWVDMRKLSFEKVITEELTTDEKDENDENHRDAKQPVVQMSDLKKLIRYFKKLTGQD
jgi:hypothetical protein